MTRRKKTSNRGKKLSESSSSINSTSVTKSDTSRESSDKKILYQKYLQNEPLVQGAPPEIKLIRQYLYDKDARNFDGMEKVTDQRCTFYFIDAETDMLPRHFYESVNATFESFPNLHFFWRYMKIAGIDSATGCTIVKVKDYYGIGRHDGKPYTFEPCEAIPATGITVRDSDVEIRFFVKDGKIMQMDIDAKGQLVGPPGFYTKIGGVIPGM